MKIFNILKYITLYTKDCHNKKYYYLLHEKSTIILTLTCSIIMAVLNNVFNINIFNKDGIIHYLSFLSCILIGCNFIILSIIPLINKSKDYNYTIDDIIENGSIYYTDNLQQEIKLSRRKYISLVFGYSTFINIAIAIISFILISFPIMYRDCINNNFLIFKDIIILIYFIIYTHMITVTLEGLYYLVFRIDDKKSEFIYKDK